MVVPRAALPILLAAALTPALSVPSALAQPGYPKLLMTGNGLGVSRVNVTRRIGSSWAPVGPKYVNGGRYRVRIRVTNFYPPYNGDVFAGGYTDKITYVRLQLVVPGPPLPPATSPTAWYTSAAFSGSGQQGTYTKDDYSALLQGRSRTYNVYFKWIGPDAPAGPVKVIISGAEENRLFVRSANLSPTP